MNQIGKKEDSQWLRVREIEAFLKEAFCIDGECAFIEFVEVKSILPTVNSMLFSLGDSKRGRFYITVSV